MKKFTKLMALLLALIMMLSLAACNNGGDEPDNSGSSVSSEDDAPKAPNRAILGNTTELSGDFRYPGWGGSSAGAADQDIMRLTTGYATMETNQSGAYVWNEVAVKEHSEVENEDGTYTVTVTINDGLTFSDGTPITAANYLTKVMAFSTPVSAAAELPGRAGDKLVGFDKFSKYTGEEAEGTSKVFSGVRLIDEHTFSVTVSSSDYPYYYAFTYAAFDPDPMGLWLGDGVEIKDDGEGCYLSDEFYAKNDAGEYLTVAHMKESRYDVSKYPFSGPYTVTNWDEGTKECTLTLNPEFKGNFEGQKPSIETIVYGKIIEETQLEQLKTGALDVLSNVTGGDATKAALEVVDNEKFKEVHYQRAGYGKIEFECDFGPTSFPEVRQAVAYLLNRAEFCQAFTGGYGVVVDGPYSPDFDMWQAVKDDIDLIDYSFSPDNAVKALEEGGWIYNSKGEPYVAGASGVDAVRYKKLTAEEANAKDIYGNDAGNKTYASVANTDNVVYKTVEINGEYYMPLAINWYGTQPNSVTNQLKTAWQSNENATTKIGMYIQYLQCEFGPGVYGQYCRDAGSGYDGNPTCNAINFATGFNSAAYDFSFNMTIDPAQYDNYSAYYLMDEADFFENY